MKLIGYRTTSFTADDGSVINGYRLYTIGSFGENATNCYGQSCDVLKFVKLDVFNHFLEECALKKVSPIGQDIVVYYNKYKKPQTIMLND